MTTKIKSGLIADNAIVSAHISSGAISSAHLSSIDTDNVSEGSSNLYFTTARARTSLSVTDSGGDGSLAYDNSTGAITYTGPSATEVRAHISVTDSGGDGSLAYSNGVITYTGPSAAEVRAHLSAGTGVTYSSGAISIGQSVATTASPTFADINVTGNINVTGDLNTVSVADLDVTDQTITLGAGQNEASSGGSGIVIDGSGASLLWDESNDEFDFNKSINVTGNIAVSGTVDGIDIAARDAILTSTTTTAGAALPKAGGTMTGSLTSNSSIKTTAGIEIASAQPRLLLDRGDGAYIWNIYNGGGTDFPESSFNIANNSGTAVVTALDNGKVGIGTTAPRSILDLDGGSETQLRLQTTNSGSAASDGLLISLDSSTNAKAYIWNYENAETIFGTNNAERMRIDASGRVGIGAVAPTDGTLHVQTASAGTVAASTQADDIVIENNAEGGMTIITPDDQSARIRFTSPSTNTDVGGATIFYRQNINKMLVGTAVSGGVLSLASGAGNETMVLDASGTVLINSSTSADTGGNKLFINSGVNAVPATSGTTQTGGALRLRGANNAVLDMGLNSVYTWIQATDKANLANGYPITLNPNGGNVGIGNMLSGAPLHVDPAANVTTGFGAPLIKVGGDNSWAGNGSLYSVGFGYVDNSITNKSPVEIGIKTTTNAGYTRGDLVFATRASTNNIAPTERMRIHSSGDMIYGGGATGVHEKHFFGITTGNAAVSHDITHTSDTNTGTVLHIQAAFTHHPSYDCVLETWVSRRGSTFSHAEQFRRDTSLSGSWTVSYVSSTVTRVTKNAGTYVGGGPYWIKAVWKNYD